MTKLAMRYDLTERPNRVKRISKKWIMKLYYVLSVNNKDFFFIRYKQTSTDDGRNTLHFHDEKNVKSFGREIAWWNLNRMPPAHLEYSRIKTCWSIRVKVWNKIKDLK